MTTSTPTTEALHELENQLNQRMPGLAHFDALSRVLYSSDASTHQIEPLGVVFPRHGEDLCAAVEAAAALKIPVLPRGAGTGLAGQTIGAALIIDCARHMNRVLSLNRETHLAEVEPGVAGGPFNRQAALQGLQFGPDPASVERATFGGMIGNNSTGAHSIRYGMTSDHVMALDAVLSDGSAVSFGALSEAAASAKAKLPSLEGRIYAEALRQREQYAQVIAQDWPRVWRRASGYSLNYLTGFTPGQPPAWFAPDEPYVARGEFNLAPVLTGSEGTLVVIRKATVRLVPRPAATVLVVLAFPSTVAACQAVPELLHAQPGAMELFPGALIAAARRVPTLARRISFVTAEESGPDAALLVAEFTGDTPAEALAATGRLNGRGRVVTDLGQQADLWAVRAGGMGLITNIPGLLRPLDFIEDVSVPVERLGEYVTRVDAILTEHGTSGVWYAHASAGCLHFRPMINIRTAQGLADMRSIAEQTAAVAASLRGSMSGEHGDGLARSEFVTQIFGERLTRAFTEFKHTFDPDNVLNPGKVLPEPGRGLDKDLRYSPTYQTIPVNTLFAYRKEEGFAGATEACVGAGVCLQEGGVMCPSYQATRDEMHVTRGRANALRAAMSGRLPKGALTGPQLHQALDLCLECKGCKAECPATVDMARMKAEFLNMYQAEHGVPLRSQLFGQIHAVSRAVKPVAGLANWFNGLGPVRQIMERTVGIAHQRPLPQFQSHTFSDWFNKRSAPAAGAKPVALFVDTYTEYNHPALGQAAVRVLEAAGCTVELIAQQGCCGRPMISKGLLPAAKAAAARNIEALAPYVTRGLPIIGLEPSCQLTLRDEYLEFFPDDPRAQAVARASFLIEEFLTQPEADGQRPVDRLRFNAPKGPWLLHGHCHAKSLVGTAPTLALLRATGAEVSEIASGCCGMAGSFGYEAEHYEISMQIGGLKLFPAVKEGTQAGASITAHGVSCRAQIQEGTGVIAKHPIEMLADCLMA
jgi:FAD/FMN-containing dehydrogenase/Fe-S oxidoreductase